MAGPLRRRAALPALSLAMIGTIVVALLFLARQPDLQGTPVARIYSSAGHVAQAGQPGDELTVRFQQAAMMLHAGRYEPAVAALHRVLELSPRLPEAHVNMGYALLGLKRYAAARDFFLRATDLRPYQGNAYWGLAETYEKLGDLPAALGAMRIYIHLAKPGDPYVRRARSAIWEWEYQLKRGPLPEDEQQFLARGTEQWEERNSPRRDSPPTAQRDIPVRSLMDERD